MNEDLVGRVASLAGSFSRARKEAEDELGRALKMLDPEIQHLIAAAQWVKDQKGATFDGKSFMFTEPEKKRAFFDSDGVIHKCAFEAEFAEDDSPFGLWLSIAPKSGVALELRGGPAGPTKIQWRVSADDYALIGDAFLAWLEGKRVHTPPKADPRRRGSMDWRDLD